MQNDSKAPSFLSRYAALVEPSLAAALPIGYGLQKQVVDAMAYSLLDGGKRIRAALVLEFARLCSLGVEVAMPFACAVEMIHAYSLIHDDLPCMDDDDLRRGKPSCHIAFPEEVALLAGDALLSQAFVTALSAKGLPPERVLAATRALAVASGAEGMVGGQIIDLACEKQTTDYETLKTMHAGKTGAMLIASCEMGVLAAGGTSAQLAAAHAYGENVGRVFQMIDDILDATGDEKTLGKPIGSDVENQKTTYVTLFGVDQTRKMAAEIGRTAQKALDPFGAQADNLRALSEYLLTRDY